jgi:NAD(P)-dependent dehydrogenase (short-subunit alcohol dehydrogenase family)
LIVRLLLKAVQKSSDGRVVWVSSVAHRCGSFVDWGRFHHPSGSYTVCKGWAYSQSKLANILMAHDFQRRYGGVNLSFNAVHPGIVNTGIMRGLPHWMQVVGEKVGVFLFMSAREGAAGTLQAALSPQLRGNGGNYFDRCKVIRSSALSYDAAFAQTLFQLSEEWTNQYV